MKSKIIGGAVVITLVIAYFVSPWFQAKVRNVWDSIGNMRYGTAQRQQQGQSVGNADALAQQCRNNMAAIEAAKQAILDTRIVENPGAGVTFEEIRQRLGPRAQLTCPQTGEAYMLGSRTDNVSCSVGNNGTPTYTADDHIIHR
ncbi:hypothetical protein JXA47_13100 [Candidatus Sumerlaeota bacterium]|nr:hypothetical protein [Candidatus Sumerlaeota bacterium]